MSDLPDASKLRAQAQRNRIDFLNTNLDLCFTFADLVQTEIRMSDQEAAQQALSKAEEGYATIARFLPRVKDDEARDEITKRLSDLRDAIDNAATSLAMSGLLP